MAIELDNLLEGLCEREESSGCYKCKISGIEVYNLIRFVVRNIYLQDKGYNFVEKYNGANYYQIIKSSFISFFQISKIWLLKRKYNVLFYPFLRLEHVNSIYLDKFIDPIIDTCKLDNYVIFERGRRGVHYSPRIHSDKVINSNIIDFFSYIVSSVGLKWFEKKYKQELEDLFHAIDFVLEGVSYNKNSLVKSVIYHITFVKLYIKLLHRMEIKKIFGPSRANLYGLIYAARRNNIIVSEFQHGITYGETALYSGRRQRDYVPDYFLAFGDTPPRNVYGIDESRIYNIGWAFQDYLDKTLTKNSVSENDVLVISGPCLTDKILDATIRLAKLFPMIQFVVRPHPAEVVTDAHRERASKYANISWQDPKINVAVAMNQYNHLIGENSTVLYEALTYGKKVARICFEGFSPRYLTPEDEECFWKINDKASFESFINGKVEDKKSMKIYSKFDKELFLKLYNA